MELLLGLTGFANEMGANSIYNDDADAVAQQRALVEGYDFPNLFDESMPMIWISKLVYGFSYIMREARSEENSLEIPAELMNKFKDKRLDVRELNGGNGLSFNQIDGQFAGQVEELKRLKLISDYEFDALEDLKKFDNGKFADQLFLQVFDSVDEYNDCVYGIFKDTSKKRIIITFRGSHTFKDWLMNFSAQMVKIRVPKLLRENFKSVHGHRGFYEYLFKDGNHDGSHTYDKILDDIKPFVEKGYKIYVTGHSLGAALSTMLAFKLAGSSKAWIPKPITCISVESPFVAGATLKDAFKQLEQDGLIRHLRITNSRSTVPAIPMIAPSILRPGLYHHVGIHLNLFNRNNFRVSYPRKGGGWLRAIRNSILKPIWFILKYHDVALIDERMCRHKKELSDMTIDGIYKDESIVGIAVARE